MCIKHWLSTLRGLSLPRESMVRLTDRLDITLDVYCGCKTTQQQQCNKRMERQASHVQDGCTASNSAAMITCTYH